MPDRAPRRPSAALSVDEMHRRMREGHSYPPAPAGMTVHVPPGRPVRAPAAAAGQRANLERAEDLQAEMLPLGAPDGAAVPARPAQERPRTRIGHGRSFRQLGPLVFRPALARRLLMHGPAVVQVSPARRNGDPDPPRSTPR